MDNKQLLIDWGAKALSDKGAILEHPPETIVETPWSIVLRFLTTNGCFYLKQTPPDLFVELEIIKLIQENIPIASVPSIVMENVHLNCFLMESCGDFSLRTKFKGTIDQALLIKGLHAYIDVMRSSERDLDLFAGLIPDWRIKQIPGLFVELIENNDLLLDEGLTQDEIQKLKALLPSIELSCELLLKYQVKETLVNADFNENNLIIDEKSQKIAIIDWGESVLSHPFFSIASHLRNNARRYKLALDGELLEKIKQQCLSRWLDVANLNELNAIYQHIENILPIFSTLAIYRLQTATHHKSKEQQNWFIAGFLRTLLDNQKRANLQ
ncbi:MAG: phosphotransferase [Candidatus Berkiella sp.]